MAIHTSELCKAVMKCLPNVLCAPSANVLCWWLTHKEKKLTGYLFLSTGLN